MKKFLWCFIAVFSVLSGLTAQTRIAILGDIEKNRAEIDMLTERFSKERNIVLLERSEIDKIIAEQKLSLLSNSDAMKLGAMLGARGMIIIKSFEWEGKNILSARLVATKSGAILGAWIQDTPSTEAFHFADGVKFSFMPLISKLFLERKDIIALSLLNIRSAIDSPETKELERNITLLFSQRLMCEKNFVVLERWRLNNIAWEKELNLDNNPFWTGSYILDGSVESLHDGNGTVKVVLRLRKPGEKEATLIEVSGSTLDLKGLVEKMTVTLREKLGTCSRGNISWDIEKEADFYFNEAQWLLRAGAFERAREAADSAFALGKTGPELDFIRIKSYLGEMASATENTRQGFFNAIRHNLPKPRIKYPLSISNGEIDKLLQAFDIYVKVLAEKTKPIKYQDKEDWNKIKYELNKEVLYTIRKVFSEKTSPEIRKKALLLRLLFKKFIALTIDENRKFRDETYLSDAIGIIFETPDESIAEYERILSEKFPNPRSHSLALHFIAKSIQTGKGQLLVWNSPDKYDDGDGHEFFVDVTGHFKEVFDKLEGTDKIREQLDAFVLAGNKIPKEKISSVFWKYKDQFLRGDENEGGILNVMVGDNRCPPEITVKILMYAFSQEYLWNEYRINYLTRRLLKYSNGKPVYDEHIGELAEAFYIYYEKIKNKKTSSFNETKKFFSSISKFRPENKDISKDIIHISPVLSSSISDLFPNDMNFKIKKMTFQNDFLQIDGYSIEGKFNCKGCLIYCDEKSPLLSLVVNESNMAELSVTGKANLGMMFKNGDNIFFLSPAGEIQVRNQGIWKKLTDTEFKNVNDALCFGDMLYIVYADDNKKTPSAVLRYDMKNGILKIISSSRRNPPLSILDNCPPWITSMISYSDSGILSLYIPEHDNREFIYSFDTIGNNWKIHKYQTPSSQKEYGVFRTEDGLLQRIDISAFKVDFKDKDERPFTKRWLTAGNGRDILRIIQLDETLFEIRAINMNDGKFIKLRFEIDKKFFPEASNFIHYFATSSKRAYLIFGSSRLKNLTLFAFDLDSLMKPVQNKTAGK